MSTDRKPKNTPEHQAQQDTVDRMTAQAERRWDQVNPAEGVAVKCAAPDCMEDGTSRIRGQAEVPGLGMIEVIASICDTHRTVVLNGEMYSTDG